MSRRGPAPMPDFDRLTARQMREIGKQAHLLVGAYDSGKRVPDDEARVTNFQRRMEKLREALAAGEAEAPVREYAPGLAGELPPWDRTGPWDRTEQRLVWEDGRIVPRSGDLARMLEDVPLGGGGKLRANQNVLVQHVLEEVPEVVGIKWRDADGTHVMAMDVDKLEVVS